MTAPANTRAKVSAATGRDKIDMDGSLVGFGYFDSERGLKIVVIRGSARNAASVCA